MVNGRGKFMQVGAGLEPIGTTRGLKGIRGYRMMDSIHFESGSSGWWFSVLGPLQLVLPRSFSLLKSRTIVPKTGINHNVKPGFPNLFLLRNWLKSSIFEASRLAPEPFPKPPDLASLAVTKSAVNNKEPRPFGTFAPSGRGSYSLLLRAIQHFHFTPAQKLQGRIAPIPQQFLQSPADSWIRRDPKSINIPPPLIRDIPVAQQAGVIILECPRTLF